MRNTIDIYMLVEETEDNKVIGTELEDISIKAKRNMIIGVILTIIVMSNWFINHILYFDKAVDQFNCFFVGIVTLSTIFDIYLYNKAVEKMNLLPIDTSILITDVAKTDVDEITGIKNDTELFTMKLPKATMKRVHKNTTIRLNYIRARIING